MVGFKANLKKDLFDGSFIFSGGEFDEKTGRSKYIETKKPASEKFFFDPAQYCIRPEFAAYRDCPICSGTSKRLIFVKDGFRHVKCEKCQFLFVDPILNDMAMTRNYIEDNDWAFVMLNDDERNINRKMYEYTLAVIKEKSPDIRDILDIGAGTGLFVETANENSYNASGIEINMNLVKRASEKGISVANKTLSDEKKSGRNYDLVTNWFILEHVSNPKRFINEVKGLLRKNGKLFISVPNIDSLATRLLESESNTFLGYQHINFFNVDSLSNLVINSGFKLLNAETYITQMNTIKKYFLKLGLTKNSGLNRFIDTLSSSYIHDNLLGAYLCCLFEKE